MYQFSYLRFSDSDFRIYDLRNEPTNLRICDLRTNEKICVSTLLILTGEI
jgi:hypothetical protein